MLCPRKAALNGSTNAASPRTGQLARMHPRHCEFYLLPVALRQTRTYQHLTYCAAGRLDGLKAAQILGAPMPIDFPTVWHRIEMHAGEKFRQKRGGTFIYSISGGCLIPDRTNRQIPRSHFEKGFGLLPLETTVPLQQLQGPSYIFAVLMDARIRGADW